jgi:hypothetical protein
MEQALRTFGMNIRKQLMQFMPSTTSELHARLFWIALGFSAMMFAGIYIFIPIGK